MDENTLTSPTGGSPFGRSSFLPGLLWIFFFLRYNPVPRFGLLFFPNSVLHRACNYLKNRHPFFFFLLYPNYYSSPLRLLQLILPIAVEGVAIMENAFLRTPAESLEHFKVSEQTGLSQSAVSNSRQQYGPNG